MSRPPDHEWDVLDESRDPIPGDPHEVRAEAVRLGRMAETIHSQITLLKDIAGDDNIGKYAEKLTSVSYTSKKYNVVAQRVGGSMAFAPLGDPDALAEFGAKAIEKAKVPDAKKKQMRKDLDDLVKDVKKALPEAG